MVSTSHAVGDDVDELASKENSNGGTDEARDWKKAEGADEPVIWGYGERPRWDELDDDVPAYESSNGQAWIC